MEFYEREMSIGSSIYNYLLEKDIKLFLIDIFRLRSKKVAQSKKNLLRSVKTENTLSFYFQALSSASGVKGVSLTVRDVTREQHLA